MLHPTQVPVDARTQKKQPTILIAGAVTLKGNYQGLIGPSKFPGGAVTIEGIFHHVACLLHVGFVATGGQGQEPHDPQY